MRQSAPAPDPNVLFYRRTRKNGRIEVATVQTISHDEANQAWRAQFLVPGQAPFFMDQYSSELNQWEPVYALTQTDISDITERVAQRVVEIMGTQGATPADIITTGMEVVSAPTVEKAVEIAVKAATPVEEPVIEALIEEPVEAIIEELISPEPEAFTCPTCAKSYKYEKSYKKHLRKAHGK